MRGGAGAVMGAVLGAAVAHRPTTRASNWRHLGLESRAAAGCSTELRGMASRTGIARYAARVRNRYIRLKSLGYPLRSGLLLRCRQKVAAI